MAVKTREKLIDVACQLFARNGVENTTMNDIAEASEKGRRTIYTYFKNKLEIFNAVIERESEQSVVKLREVLSLNLTATEKIELFYKIKFKSVQEELIKQDSLYSYFSLDLKRFNRIRRLTSTKETEILQSILAEGISAKEFSPIQAKKLISLNSVIFQGLDMSIYKDTTISEEDKKALEENILEYIIAAIKL